MTDSSELLRAVTVSLCRLLLKLYKQQGAEFPGSKAIQKSSENSVMKSSQQLFCLGTVKLTPRAKAHGVQKAVLGGEGSHKLVQVGHACGI